MRIKHKSYSALSSTSAGEKDLGNHDPDVYEICDVMPEGGSRRYKIAGSANLNLDMAGVANGQYIHLKTTRNIVVTVTVSAVTRAIPVVVPSGFNFGYFMVTTDGVTAINVANSTSNEVEVTVQLAGDTP